MFTATIGALWSSWTIRVRPFGSTILVKGMSTSGRAGRAAARLWTAAGAAGAGEAWAAAANRLTAAPPSRARRRAVMVMNFPQCDVAMTDRNGATSPEINLSEI
ncbi:hypothetical protein D3C72_1831750 [compost metagenome]